MMSMWSIWNFHTLAVVSVKWWNHFRDSMAFSNKEKHILPNALENPLLFIYGREMNA